MSGSLNDSIAQTAGTVLKMINLNIYSDSAIKYLFVIKIDIECESL